MAFWIFAAVVIAGHHVLVDSATDATAAPARNGTRTVLAYTTSDVMRLKSHLTDAHDSWVRPDLGKPTEVDITLGIKHIALSEMQSVVSVSAYVKLEWWDSRSTWKDSTTKEFQAIKVLHLSKQDIWFPDIVLKNGLAGKGEGLLEGATASLYPDGRVVWAPSAVLTAYCQLDLRRWPFEQHQCSLLMGSWTLDRSQLKIGNVSHRLEFPGLTGEFVVDKVTQEYDERLEEGLTVPFSGVLYSIAMHREPGTYRAVIYTPAVVVIVLCLATFLLPPRAGEKVILGGVNAVLICLFLIYFADSLPVLTNQTPLIVVFYAASLYLVCLSLVAAVVVMNIARQPHAAGLPWPLKHFLTGTCGRALLLSSYIEQMMGVEHGPCSGSGVQEEMPVVMAEQLLEDRGSSEAIASPRSCAREIGSRRVSPHLDWLLLAAAIDRVLFLVYSLLFVILAVAFHV